MNVEDIMTKEVVTVGVDATMGEVAKLLCERAIGGIPVLADDNKIVGIVNDGDMLPKLKRLPFARVKLPTLFGDWLEEQDLEEMFEQAKSLKVLDIMQQRPICVEIGTSVADAVNLFLEHGLRRLPVVQDGVLVGIIARNDLIRALSGSK